MALQQLLHDDLVASIKNGNTEAKDVLRVTIAELQREPTKNLPDDRVIKIIRKLINWEEESAKTMGSETRFANVLSRYLPKEVTDEEIIMWIRDNIDFSKYGNKMQAMKDIMVEFTGRVDGGRIKILLDLF